ncbi:MAG: HAD-IC family P-type ATPase [Legionellales bacterium]|nr:HAD-IC family P-type ATPase [Legionellales bacterium]
MLAFYQQIREKTLNTMATPITLGWLLSLAHTLYHAITMPTMQNPAMTFMNYLMPILLITTVNAMDEIKRRVLSQSKKMHLQGMKTLFPQMSKTYEGMTLPIETQNKLSEWILNMTGSMPFSTSLAKTTTYLKQTLSEGMLIVVKRGECFPVDGIILQGHTLIDASILTGEPQQQKRPRDKVPGGSINLGQDVLLYVTQNTYNSTVNRLLFRSNRAHKNQAPTDPSTRFSYVYLGLIVIGLVASIMVPIALGIATFPLILQNIIGILFAICPCTIAIAHFLPKLISVYRRHQQGIILRREEVTESTQPPHTIVFDKTGTLTTGRSDVDSSEGISPALWKRIYLLEDRHGAGHPIAKAIIRCFNSKHKSTPLIKDLQNASIDPDHRGLSAMVQGKRVQMGHFNYLKSAGVNIPNQLSQTITQKLALGMTPIYVAEDGIYQGIILIKHEVRNNILGALKRLKAEGKTLIMLTGDNSEAAIGFNQQQGNLFQKNHIHASHTPQMKESFLKNLMSQADIDPKGVWFVGDGLNDAPCARMVSDKGGVSASMTHDDKAAFFTDLSLDGSLDYLFEHHRLNRFLKKNVTQNQGLLIYGALVFLAFILCFSVIGIAVSPLIPMAVMVSTTLLTLFNAYRVSLSVNHALDKKGTWFSQWMASDGSIGLLLGGISFFLCGLFVASIATGGLALPALTFTAGAITAIYSICMLAAGVLGGAFALLGIGFICSNKSIPQAIEKTPEKAPLIPHPQAKNEMAHTSAIGFFPPHKPIRIGSNPYPWRPWRSDTNSESSSQPSHSTPSMMNLSTNP